MAQLAREGSRPNLVGSIDSISAWVRNYYDYRAEEEEVVRTPDRMWEDYNTTGRFEGDCDDIATFLASIFFAIGYTVRFVAIRYNAANPDFEHVYVEVWDGHEWRVIDPTVPEGTKYQIIERMELSV